MVAEYPASDHLTIGQNHRNRLGIIWKLTTCPNASDCFPRTRVDVKWDKRSQFRDNSAVWLENISQMHPCAETGYVEYALWDRLRRKQAGASLKLGLRLALPDWMR